MKTWIILLGLLIIYLAILATKGVDVGLSPYELNTHPSYYTAIKLLGHGAWLLAATMGYGLLAMLKRAPYEWLSRLYLMLAVAIICITLLGSQGQTKLVQYLIYGAWLMLAINLLFNFRSPIRNTSP